MSDSDTASPKIDGGVFSLDDIDKIIETEDPGFKNQIDAIKSDSIGDESLEASNISTDEEELSKEDEDTSSHKKIIQLLFRPVVKFKQFWTMRWIAAKNRTIMFADNSKNFFRHELPERLRYLRSQFLAVLKYLKNEWLRLKALPRAQKVGLLSLVLISWAALYLFIKSFSSDFLPQFSDVLPRSFAERADFVGQYKDKSDLQALFAAFPEVEYHVLLDKVIVNLTADSESSLKPMGAFQFYIGVDAQDTAIEIKQRERELLDLMQRTLEGFTYSEVMSKVGKVRVKSAIRDRINEILNQGKVTHIYFNMIVTYP